jgi:hypothetical protein
MMRLACSLQKKNDPSTGAPSVYLMLHIDNDSEHLALRRSGFAVFDLEPALNGT